MTHNLLPQCMQGLLSRGEVQHFLPPQLLPPSAVFKWYPLLWRIDMSASAASLHDGKNIQAHFWLSISKTWVSLLVGIKFTSNLIWIYIISSMGIPWCPTLLRCGEPCRPLTQCFTASPWEMSLLIPSWRICPEQHKKSHRGLEMGLTSLKPWSEEWLWTPFWGWHYLLCRTLRPNGVVGTSHGDTSQKAQADPCWHGPCYSEATAECPGCISRWSGTELI